MFEKTFSFWRRLVGNTAAQPTVAAAGQEDRRLWVRYETDIQGKVQLAEHLSTERQTTIIRDLSVGGANLFVERPFQPGQMLSVEIPADNDEIVTVLACVVRLTPAKENWWSLGCVFSRELSNEDLCHLGAKKVQTEGEDQRKWVRYPCEIKVSYRKVGEPGDISHSAQILDVSASGIGLSVTPPLETGSLVNVELTDKQGRVTRPILACVVHTTLRANGELAVGCNFIRELSEDELRSLL